MKSQNAKGFDSELSSAKKPEKVLERRKPRYAFRAASVMEPSKQDPKLYYAGGQGSWVQKMSGEFGTCQQDGRQSPQQEAHPLQSIINR